MNDLTEKQFDAQVEIKSDVRKKFMTGVYLWMMLALIISAVVSVALVASPAARQALFASSGVFWGLLIAELVLVFVLSLAIHRISAGTAAALFLGLRAGDGGQSLFFGGGNVSGHEHLRNGHQTRSVGARTRPVYGAHRLDCRFAHQHLHRLLDDGLDHLAGRRGNFRGTDRLRHSKIKRTRSAGRGKRNVQKNGHHRRAESLPRFYQHLHLSAAAVRQPRLTGDRSAAPVFLCSEFCS